MKAMTAALVLVACLLGPISMANARTDVAQASPVGVLPSCDFTPAKASESYECQERTGRPVPPRETRMGASRGISMGDVFGALRSVRTPVDVVFKSVPQGADVRVGNTKFRADLAGGTYVEEAARVRMHLDGAECGFREAFIRPSDDVPSSCEISCRFDAPEPVRLLEGPCAAFADRPDILERGR